MKKIAIFHNLKSGGGLNQIKNITYELSKLNFEIDIYSHNKFHLRGENKYFFYPIKKTNNLITQLFQVIFELNNKQREISKTIINKRYDYVFVFPCNIIQSPHILRFLPRKNLYYFFLEPKREFYEKTSFDHHTLKRYIYRLLRYPIKIYDQINCKNSQNIISNSIFSKNNLKRIYKKDSMVLYPGMKRIKPTKIIIKNNHRFLSLGILSMLKGHHISSALVPEVSIYGQKSHENINNYLSKNTSTKDYVHENKINNIYKNHTFFLANQINEPFGLTTLESLSNNCYVIGQNCGGTSEIIDHGYNGTLLNVNNLITSKMMINQLNISKTISYYKTCIIDWSSTAKNLLNIIKYE